MTEDFYYFYDQYEKYTYFVHMGIRVYFRMHMEKFLFINGSNKNQLEIAESEDHDLPIGFGNKDTVTLQNQIEQIRANVPYY